MLVNATVYNKKKVFIKYPGIPDSFILKNSALITFIYTLLILSNSGLFINKE